MKGKNCVYLFIYLFFMKGVVKNRASTPGFHWGVLNGESKLEKKGIFVSWYFMPASKTLFEKITVLVVAVLHLITLWSLF